MVRSRSRRSSNFSGASSIMRSSSAILVDKNSSFLFSLERLPVWERSKAMVLFLLKKVNEKGERAQSEEWKIEGESLFHHG